jgi:hypothetical protein
MLTNIFQIIQLAEITSFTFRTNSYNIRLSAFIIDVKLIQSKTDVCVLDAERYLNW